MHNDAAKKRHNHFEYQTEYTTDNDSNYRLQDLSVRSWLDLAEKIARPSLPSLDGIEEEVEASIDEGVEPLMREQKHEEEKKGKKKGDEPKKTKNHLWHVFVKRAYVHTKPDAEIQKRFGDE